MLQSKSYWSWKNTNQTKQITIKTKTGTTTKHKCVNKVFEIYNLRYFKDFRKENIQLFHLPYAKIWYIPCQPNWLSTDLHSRNFMKIRQKISQLQCPNFLSSCCNCSKLLLYVQSTLQIETWATQSGYSVKIFSRGLNMDLNWINPLSANVRFLYPLNT